MDSKIIEVIKRQINDADKKIIELGNDIELARRAGLDVSEKNKQLDALKGQLFLLKSAFNA